MNPRDFCSLPGFQHAILLTFDFQPLFFERVCLPDLWSGGTGDTLVLADTSRLDQLTTRWRDQLLHLGRNYQLVKIAQKGAFHPKLILRFGKNEAAVWVGSGNITYGGWGGNVEASTAWLAGPEHEDSGGWIPRLLYEIRSWISFQPEHDVVERVLELPWIGEVQSFDQEGPVLVGTGDSSLSAQLAQRWAGRRFDTAKIVTGSTDPHAAFPRWLTETFGVSRCSVVVDSRNASFTPKALDSLPARFDLLAPLDRPPLHAKFYWFDGPDGPAAIVGSANCSAAAWGLTAAGEGNTEIVTVFDSASESEFSSILEVFEAHSVKPIPMASLPTHHKSESPSAMTGHAVGVGQVTWEPSLGQIRVLFSSPVPEDSKVSVVVDDHIYRCYPTLSDECLWICEPELPPAHRRARFIEVLIDHQAGDVISLHHWVNHLGELRHASGGRRAYDRLKDLGTRTTASEHSQIVKGVAQVAFALLSDPAAFPDPLSATTVAKNNDQDEKEPEAPPIDPSELVRSIDSIPEESHGNGHGPAHDLSLSGVMRALFFVEEELEDEHTDADDGEPEYGAGPKPKKDGSENGATDTQRPDTPPEKLRERLRNSLSDYLRRLVSDDFLSNCTATQMVQAAAFPLVVGTLGTRSGWVIPGDARDWAIRVFDILFRLELKDGDRGLLAAIRQRYENDGRLDDFERIAGDGTLWLASLYSLAGSIWQGESMHFERALAVKAVFGSRNLLASASPGKLRLLIRQLGEQTGDEKFLEEANLTSQAVESLHDYLTSHFETLQKRQSNDQFTTGEGDLFWRHGAGWAVAQEEAEFHPDANIPVHLHLRAETRTVKAGFYVNVSHAMHREPKLKALVGSMMRESAEESA